MDVADRRRLRKNRSALVDNLEPSRVLDRLIELEVFTPDMTEEITAQKVIRDQVRDLLRKLELRGSTAYGRFRQVLLEMDYEYLVETLDKTELENADEVDSKPITECKLKSNVHPKTDLSSQAPQNVTNNVNGNNNFAIFCGHNTTIHQYGHH